MTKDGYFWLGISANSIWVALGLLCFLIAAGLVSAFVTWWLFGIGLIVGGIMGLISMLQS